MTTPKGIGKLKVLFRKVESWMTSRNTAAYLWTCYWRDSYFVLATVHEISVRVVWPVSGVLCTKEGNTLYAQITSGSLSPAWG